MTIEELVHSNYAQAVAELAKIKKSPLLKQLQKGPTSYNTEKLIYELTKLGFNADEVTLELASIPEGSVVISEAELAALKEQVNQAVIVQTESVNEETVIEDEILKQLHQQRVAAWKEASFTHTQLANQDLSNEEALVKCQRILELTNDVIPGIDAREKYYKEHGQLPAEKQADEGTNEYPALSGVQLYKRLDTLRKNISRDKKQRPEYVPKWEAELAVREKQWTDENNGPTE